MEAVLIQQVQTHPVYRALNKPLTIWGLDRRLFFFALVIGGATFNYFGSLLSGMATFCSLYAAARWVTANDVQMIRILLNAGRWRPEYDPGKRDPFAIEVLPQ
jgi:type IV secretory pathway VirB3-like protein